MWQILLSGQSRERDLEEPMGMKAYGKANLTLFIVLVLSQVTFFVFFSLVLNLDSSMPTELSVSK